MCPIDPRPDTVPFPFLEGNGEMASRMREFDWVDHPLGTPYAWPLSLKMLLGVLLNNPFPMFLFWGPEQYCFYNDAYRPSLGKEGKHPGILGMLGKEAWEEIWSAIAPLLQQVMKGGPAVWSEDQLIPIYRNGCMEDVYWTFSYSPIREDKAVLGVLVTCVETTAKVIALNKLAESERQLNLVIDQAPVAVAILKGPTFRTTMVNGRALELWGRNRDEVLDRPLLEAMPELVEQGIPAMLKAAYQRSERFMASEYEIQLLRDRELRKVYINFVFEPLLDEQGNVDGVMAVGSEVTETVLSKQRAEAGEARFRALADSMPQFVWTGTADGHLNYFNRSVYAYSGLSEQEVQEKGWLQIVHPDEQEANVTSWTEAISNGTDFLFEHRFMRHDGVYRWQLSRAVPLRDGDGNVIMWVGTSTDIQDIKQQDQLKDDFIGMASHEFRDPISALRGYVDFLSEEYANGSDETLQQALKAMDRQTTHLTQLVNGLLDLSKMKAGMVALDRTHFCLNDLVRQIVEEQALISARVKFVYEPSPEAMVNADKQRITQVLQNLLSNAVKYAPGGDRVVVTSKCMNNLVVVSIMDKGIGISPDDQSKVFSKFYRVSGKDQHTFTGFGIGLSLSADIVELHQGEIGVKSELGKGSTFWFSLPIGGERSNG